MYHDDDDVENVSVGTSYAYRTVSRYHFRFNTSSLSYHDRKKLILYSINKMCWRTYFARQANVNRVVKLNRDALTSGANSRGGGAVRQHSAHAHTHTRTQTGGKSPTRLCASLTQLGANNTTVRRNGTAAPGKFGVRHRHDGGTRVKHECRSNWSMYDVRSAGTAPHRADSV